MFLSVPLSALTPRDGKEFSPIVGFFIDAGLSEVIVRKWDQQEERLVKISEEEVLIGLEYIQDINLETRYAQAVQSLEFDKQLGPYTLSQYGEWKQLSSYITKCTIECFEPTGGEITVKTESGITKSTPKTVMEKALDEQLKSTKFSMAVDKPQRKGYYYTPGPRVIKCRGMQGEELTSLNLDKRA